uniref:Isoform 2 of Nitric oxide synthase n=1 Tax=Drosophila melanogaster TaxID=7227 RepID=Q27571-2
MSQHFTSIFENLRFVTIKRSTNAQQQQQQQQQQLQQQQQQLQQQKAQTQQQNSRKIKTQATPTLNGNGLLSGNPNGGGGDSSPSHEVDHPGGAQGAQAAGGLPSSSGTPLRHHKRASISTASPPIRERRGTNTSIVVELDGSGSGSGSGGGGVGVGQGAGCPPSGSCTASGKSSRELSPSPKNQQQPRKMSQDYRSRAGSFMHLDDEGRSLLMRKPMRLKNIEGRPEVYDTLHCKGREILSCSKATCTSSIMNIGNAAVEARKSDLILEHAKDFLEQYFTSIKRTSSTAHETRWKQVRQSIETTGHYQLTETELIYGAKLAWRNSSRCIGRIQWSKLQVFDCRYVTTTSGMFEAICNHIKYATNKGNLRSAITIFPQRTDAKHDYRIWNNQLISYAGYKQADGKIIGDPMNVEFTETVALKMQLDTRTPTSLWKDKAVVEMNIAVLHSYQSRNVTIVDHHTASESFMKHFENESKLRNGCPADWIWIVPPLSGSITPVFHQEMALYYLKPSFEYQDPAWRTHVWKKGRGESKGKKPRRKFNFKQIARAVKFTSKLFGRALSKRIKATVLYATETGKSEQYAKQLCELLGHAFNAQIYCMSDYDISSIEHEALLIVVASTFGNGDPPENGELFSQELYAMRVQESSEHGLQDSSIGSSKSFMKASSRQEFMKLPLQQVKRIDRWDSLRGSTSDTFTEETFGPLSNVRFAVFALGSSAYPNFCAFGQYVDNILGELGGERLLRVAYGDEMCGQEQSFRKWAPEVFKLACETFCLDPEESLSDASLALQNDSLTVNTVRLVPSANKGSLDSSLSKYHNKKVHCCKAKAKPHNLTRLSEGAKTTMLLEICAPGLEYEPGDHVGIFPANRTELVDGLLNRLVGVDNPDEVLQLQLLKEKQTSNGIFKCWEPHDKIPPDTLRNLLARFFDLTTPPSRQLLTLLAGFCEDTADKERLELLVNDSSAYEDWRHWRLPHLLDVLEEFPSCRPPAPLLLAQLTPLQPRFYSISSSPRRVSDEIHLTVAIVKYRCEDGQGDERYGVCSNYLSGLRADDELFMFVRSALGFHLPSDRSRPIILIGPGTGIAPFRSFWQEFQVLSDLDPTAKLPKMWLFFGCRNRDVDLYAEEKAELQKDQILDRVFLALSREQAIPKTYVQDLIEQEFDSLYQLIVQERGHIYVCGDVTMAEHVYQTIRKCIAGKEQKSEAEVETFLLTLRDESRYHEDIFGITLRTAEIHTKSRATARIRMASQP